MELGAVYNHSSYSICLTVVAKPLRKDLTIICMCTVNRLQLTRLHNSVIMVIDSPNLRIYDRLDLNKVTPETKYFNKTKFAKRT
jgi:hypothetical protein